MRHGDSFHTPPASPQSAVPPPLPAVPQHLQPPPRPPYRAAPVSAPPPVPVFTLPLKKSQPTSPSPVPRPHSPVASNSPTTELGVRPGTTGLKGAAPLGKNGAPPTSTPRSPCSQGKTPAFSPTKSPSAPCSPSPLGGVSPSPLGVSPSPLGVSPSPLGVSPSPLGVSSSPLGVSPSPLGVSSSGQSWRERDSGLSPSLHESVKGHTEELEMLLDECRAFLGVTANHNGVTDTTEVLRSLLAEAKDLKNSLQSEREEWLQFQSDLQVAVSVADRLRGEADEELTALRKAHEDVERELAAAQQRQKAADTQLVTLRGELKESRQRLASLNQHRGQGRPPEGHGRRRSQGGTDGGVHKSEQEAVEKSNESDVTKKNGTSCRGVAIRYLRNVTNEDRNEEEARPNEARRVVTTERSRSLSRLPAAADLLTVPNGTHQANNATTAAQSNVEQQRGRRTLDWQDRKREECLNKYNSALTELPPTKSQDGFNLLLRRHGGSKRNSMLRWCQSRTQGYKNIDITNFSSSWADGLAFCAVFHTYLPSHIPYSSLTPDNKRDNLSLAFKTGETVGITPTLTVEEMLKAGGPDWQRVLGYVESMYRHFEM
ncbi:cytospin-A-like [Cynoglossus semilaevis]|uniref:cytospin-A-like n=1 Tax=Cynoglossus semilaevis TaxID=244447 RepID=UPI000D626852|nr:cytospin-A-like [Cynoglossus semilaevis]